MLTERPSKTIVIQSFRDHDIPLWIHRCLRSVRDWAHLHGHTYWLAGDEFYDLCGKDYLQTGHKNPQAITNLARLVAARRQLDAGFQNVVWMDADVFVFAPSNFVLDLPPESLSVGYALGREVWIERGENGEIHTWGPRAHNAALLFTQKERDLDILIALTKHIGETRSELHNFQLGVQLLRGLNYSLQFPTFSHVGMYSPTLLSAICDGDEAVLKTHGALFGYESCAANLGLSIADPALEGATHRAMDRLEIDAGAVVNRFAREPRLQLCPYSE